MEQWEKNVRALAHKSIRLANEIRKIILDEEKSGIQVKELANGRKILAVEQNGHVWNLNSRLDPDGAAGLYADRYTVRPFCRYFVFGISDGRAVKRILEKCGQDNVMIICEPDKHILAEAVCLYDLENFFLDQRVWIFSAEMREELYGLICHTLDCSYLELTEFCILPGYDMLYTKECKNFIDEVIEKLSHEMVRKATYLGFDRDIPRNMLFHMYNMIGQRNCVQVKKALEDTGIEGIPAIIVAAGPSLDKNIGELKKAEGRAFIIVVDAALKTALREGIRPDLICTVDAKSPGRFFETLQTKEYLLSCSCWTNPKLLEKYADKVVYHSAVVPWWDGVFWQGMNGECPKIPSGGCVSAEAFQLARYYGFRTIILVGQDLAFTGGQSHTSGIKGILGDNDTYIKNRYLVQVEDADGNLLETDIQMDFYRRWFERAIRQANGSVRVIDATEGGAKIEGTVIRPLKEAIARECVRETDIYETLRDLPPAFDEAQQNYLYRKAAELKDEEAIFFEQVEKTIALERELEEKAAWMMPEQLKGKLEKISEQTGILDHHPFIDWIRMYARKEEFYQKEDIFTKEEMDVKEVMRRGIRLLESYRAGKELFDEDLKAAFKVG